MKKRVLLITRDEKRTEKNSDLFQSSLNFCNELAYDLDTAYFQLSNMKYTDGLISQMLHTYLNNSSDYAYGIISSIDGYHVFKDFSNSTRTQIPSSAITKTLPGTNMTCTTYSRPTSTTKLMEHTVFNNELDYFASNFEYIILHHGGQEIINYFSSLNNLLLKDKENTSPLEKLILINENGIFNNMLKQYKYLISNGIDCNCISPKIMQVKNLDQCLEIIQHQMKIYIPGASKHNFSIDD